MGSKTDQIKGYANEAGGKITARCRQSYRQ